MNTPQQHGPALDEDEAVAEYLRTHPDFFVRHGKLLAELTLPHQAGSATSLVERQVSILRDQNRRIRHELRELVQIARDNESLNNRIHRLTLALLDAADLETAIDALRHGLCEDFRADSVAVHLFARLRTDLPAFNAEALDATLINRDNARLAGVQKVIERGQPICGRLTAEQLAYLGMDTDAFRSVALIPLCTGDCFGLVTVGSGDENHFHSAMGTVFLAQLSEIMSRIFRVYLHIE